MFPPNEHWDNANFPGIIYLKNKLKILKLIFDASWCKGSIQIFGLTSIFSLNGKNRMKEGGKKSGYKRKVPVGFIPKE